MIRTFAAVCATALACAALPTLAQQAATPQQSPAQAAQQERMKSCNANASGRTLKGDARQTYMSACLSGKSDQPTMMKVCNAQAGQDKLAGDARKSYMSSCLKSAK